MTDLKDYESLLDRAYTQMPESVFEKGRFEIPKAVGHIEGKKTVITNFLKIAETLRREPMHVIKYLLKELATPGTARGARLVLGTKISASLFNLKVRSYAEEFVLCHTCGKPDTDLVTEGAGMLFLKCNACGAKSHVKARI